MKVYFDSVRSILIIFIYIIYYVTFNIIFLWNVRYFKTSTDEEHSWHSNQSSGVGWERWWIRNRHVSVERVSCSIGHFVTVICCILLPCNKIPSMHPVLHTVQLVVMSNVQRETFEYCRYFSILQTNRPGFMRGGRVIEIFW